MSILIIFMLIVAGIIFLAILGKHGWNPVMRVLLVLAVMSLPLLFVAWAYDAGRLRSEQTATIAVMVEQPIQQGLITVDQAGEVELRRPDGSFFKPPIHSQMLVPERVGGLFQYQAQVRSVRGTWSVLSVLVFVGMVGFVVLYQVWRGAWTWPAIVKVGGIALAGIVACIVVVVGVRSLREASRNRANYETRTIRVSGERPLVEAPRMRPVGAPEVSLEAKRYRDVEVWRRERVLGFVPLSHREQPDWCREGLETEPESVRLNDTAFLSSLPGDRDWIAGYSSQDPVVTVAENDALAAARRKLALEALLQVKKAVPEFDTLPFEDLAWRLAMRHSIGGLQDTYIEKATLVHEQRPYGSVYRAAVRIVADPRTIDYLARRLLMNVDSSGDGRDRDVQGAFFISLILVALAFSAFLVYVFIRAGATGGWVYPLRFLSGAMLLAVAVAAVYVSVNLGTP